MPALLTLPPPANFNLMNCLGLRQYQEYDYNGGQGELERKIK